MIASVEYTDLFGGDANYAWVRRFDFDCTDMTDLQIIRRAKSELGISGMRALYSHNLSDLARYFDSTVLFITFSEESSCSH